MKTQSITSESMLSDAYPFLAVVPLAATWLFQDTLNPGVITLLGLILGGGMCVAGAVVNRRTYGRDHALVALLVAATAFWFTLASLWAASPRVSLVGLVGQNNGASLWILFAVWILAGLTCANSRSLRRTLPALTGIAAVFASAAFWEAVRWGAQRSQGYASGFFENSNSAGQLFAVGVLVAITGAIVSRNKWGRACYSLVAAMSLAALVLSSSRTGFVGLVLAGAFAGLAYLPSRMGSSKRIAAAFVALLGGLTILMTIGSAGLLGNGASQFIAKVGSGRDAIWRSALAQLAQSPLVGRGLEQFSAFQTWSLAQGQMQSRVTADPHNILLAAALGGGVIGLALLLASMSALLGSGLSNARSSQGNLGVSLIAAYPAAMLGFGLVGWVAPSALLVAAAASGAGLGAASNRSKAKPSQPDLRGAVRAIALCAGALAVVVGITSIGPFAVTQSYVRSLLPGQSRLSPASLVELYRRYPDPGIASAALEELAPSVQQGDAASTAEIKTVLKMSETDGTWSASTAINELVSAQALEAKNSQGFEEFEKYVRAGAQADPASGIWYEFAAIEARRLGLDSKASAYAQKALRYPLDDENRQLLVGRDPVPVGR